MKNSEICKLSVKFFENFLHKQTYLSFWNQKIGIIESYKQEEWGIINAAHNFRSQPCSFWSLSDKYIFVCNWNEISIHMSMRESQEF